MIYCSISILLTLLFSVLNERFIYFIQSFLYLYHMWVFFLGAVFMYFHLNTLKKYRRIVLYVMALMFLEFLLVIAQNFGVVPFLWNNEYYKAYGGFLSGTLGPNKIVLGMYTMISIAFLIGFSFLKNIKIPKTLLYGTLLLALLALLLSGSRTSYVGVLTFLGYFLFKSTGRFLRFLVLGVFFACIIVLVSPSIVSKIDDVFQDRITYVIEGPEDVQQFNDVEEVYSELSTGRDKLHIKYINYLLDNPLVIPFGKGFNNRMGVGNSAHNIYLSLINEVGLVGLGLFLSWLFSYFIIVKKKLPGIQLALNGLVIGMLVTLYFGEHLYIYRPLFAILGFFLIITVLFLIPFKKQT